MYGFTGIFAFVRVGFSAYRTNNRVLFSLFRSRAICSLKQTL